jgi:hypothetical protein
MTTERDNRTRVVLSWLREDAHENAERVLLSALDEVDATPQRRSWWPARRSTPMTKYASYGIASAAVLVVAVVGYSLLPRTPTTGGDVTPAPTASSQSSPNATQLTTRGPGTFTSTPFRATGLGVCPAASSATDCVEDPRDDTITFTFRVPDGWDSLAPDGAAWVDANAPPDGSAVIFSRGSWLYSDPCLKGDLPTSDIPVGPTVADLVAALVEHPELDVTTPVDVTLAGYVGKRLDVQVPDDISECLYYQPMDQHIYAQGPGQRWHLWILDVGGVRVVIETNDYAGTPQQRLSEAQAILASIRITP